MTPLEPYIIGGLLGVLVTLLICVGKIASMEVELKYLRRTVSMLENHIYPDTVDSIEWKE